MSAVGEYLKRLIISKLGVADDESAKLISDYVDMATVTFVDEEEW